jgi:hypothetical protein
MIAWMRLPGTPITLASWFWVIPPPSGERRILGLASDAPTPEIKLLAVFSGGDDGAFGAGLLCGWPEQGSRPTFGG